MEVDGYFGVWRGFWEIMGVRREVREIRRCFLGLDGDFELGCFFGFFRIIFDGMNF